MAYGQNNEQLTRFYLAHDMSRFPVGARLFDSPPHITQCSPVQVEASRLPDVSDYLASLVGETEPIALRSIGQAIFGSKEKPVFVTQFAKPKALEKFHSQIIHTLSMAGCEFIGLEHPLEDYNPHTAAVMLDPGVEVTMDNLTVFTRRQTPQLGGMDEITARYEFSSQARLPYGASGLA